MVKLEFDGAHFASSKELADHLIAGIRSGRYESRHRFPSQASMARRIGVGRGFVGRAYARVDATGLVTNDKVDGLVVK